MTRALFMVLVLGSAAAAQEDCQASEAEEVGLLQGRHQSSSRRNTPEPEPTPAPTPYAGPFWTPGSGACYISVCTSEEATYTGTTSWCGESCEKTEPNGPRQFCPNGKKATLMTQFCHASEDNCEQCNGQYSDYSPPLPPKACYIGVCALEEASTGTTSWCGESCEKTEPNGTRQFCPNGKTETLMTPFCHASADNCKQCNGEYGDY